MGIVEPVVVELDRPRKLRFDLGAQKAFYRETGVGIQRFDQENPEHICALIWASLLRDDPSLTVDQVDEMIDMGNLEYVFERVTEAINRSMPQKQAQGKN